MTLTALVIDDERLARLTLRKDLEKFPDINIIGEASGVKMAKSMIEQMKPDLLFLDVQMMDGTAFDLLNQIEYSGKIIFITAYDKYALRAFEVNAVDYLLKPVSLKRLSHAIEKLSDEDVTEKPPASRLNYDDRLLVMHKNAVNFIKISTITAVCASREYSYIHSSDGKVYLSSTSISDWENRLPDKNFIRIHRSTIINFDFIVKIDHHVTGTAEVILQGFSEPLDISRNYFKKLKRRYSI